MSYTTWKVSKYGTFSGPYFPTLKTRTRKTPYLDTFHTVLTSNLLHLATKEWTELIEPFVGSASSKSISESLFMKGVIWTISSNNLFLIRYVRSYEDNCKSSDTSFHASITNFPILKKKIPGTDNSWSILHNLGLALGSVKEVLYKKE